MPYENLRYWEMETWNGFFSRISNLNSKNNFVVRVKKKLKDEWEGKTLEEIYKNYEEFFQPEKKKVEEGKEILIKPWFLRFFGINFRTKDNFPVEYDGIIFRIEEGRGLGDVKIALEYGGDFSYFETIATDIDKTFEIARSKGFEIKEQTIGEIQFTSPEETRRKIASVLEEIINITIPRNGLMFFIWSLSHGVTENYARRVYEKFDDDIIFNKLGFVKEGNYGLIIGGNTLNTISGKVHELINHIANESWLKSVVNTLGIENMPTPMEDYFSQAIKAFKDGNFRETKNLVKKLDEKARDYAGGWYYFQRYTNLSNLADASGRSRGDVLRLLAPLLFLGILKYEYGRIENWTKFEQEWTKL